VAPDCFGNCNCALRLLVIRCGYSQRATPTACAALGEARATSWRINCSIQAKYRHPKNNLSHRPAAFALMLRSEVPTAQGSCCEDSEESLV